MLSPQHPRVLLALAEPPQLCNPFPWELELPGLAHLPLFILCPPSPQGSEFVPSCGSWAEAGARGQPLSVPPRRGLPGEAGILVGIMSPVTDAHADSPPIPHLPLQGEDRQRCLECPTSPSP